MTLRRANTPVAAATPDERVSSLQDLALDQAFRRRDLPLAEQPIRSLADENGQGRWVELLARPRVNGMRLAADAFINRAVERGVARELDLLILRRGFAWLQQRPDVALCSLNVSGCSLSQPRFLKDVLWLLKEVDVDPERVCIEVTESVPVHDFPSARTFAKELRAAGCRMALDDFGGGASNMLMLVPLEMDFIKIDGRFIRPMPGSADCRRVVRGVVAFARETGLRTVAECVEGAAHFELVKKMKVDFAQGYYNHGAPRMIECGSLRAPKREVSEFGDAAPDVAR